jgi:hypothetical protein
LESDSCEKRKRQKNARVFSIEYNRKGEDGENQNGNTGD